MDVSSEFLEQEWLAALVPSSLKVAQRLEHLQTGGVGPMYPRVRGGWRKCGLSPPNPGLRFQV